VTTMEAAIIARAPRRKQNKENPLGLFISVIRDEPKSDQTTHRRHIRGLLLSPGYEEFLDAVIDEWLRIKYSTAYRAAVPPTTKEIKERAERRKVLNLQEEKAVRKAKALIGERLFNLMMPNGKPLHQCTGAECIKFGSYYAKIGKAAGPDKVVGDVMSADDITTLLERA
jgi:hypothetical protein